MHSKSFFSVPWYDLRTIVARTQKHVLRYAVGRVPYRWVLIPMVILRETSTVDVVRPFRSLRSCFGGSDKTIPIVTILCFKKPHFELVTTIDPS